jgi:hypothetical protein
MMPGTDPASLPLRDIHLPDAVSWWPLAPGWWILCLLIILLGLLVVYLVRRRRRRRLSAIYMARQELHKIQREFDLKQDKAVLVKQVSELIRRLSISLFQREQAAALIGEDWLKFLDQYSDNKQFTSGIGRVLIEAPYQANPDVNSSALIDLVASWIAAVEKNKRVSK